MTLLRRSLTILVGLALAISLAGAACNDSPMEEPFELPVRLDWSVPGQGAELNDNSPIDISLDFSRSVESMDRVSVQLVPTPDQAGELRLSKSKQNLTWFDVHTRDGSSVQRLLVDGPEFTGPTILVWITQPPGMRDEAELSGLINTRDAENRRVDDTVVFALPIDDVFLPSRPETFADAVPLAYAKPDSLDLVLSEGNYRIRRMPEGATVHLVAIYDTSRDGRYDPLDDWWGMYYDPSDGSPGEVQVWPVCDDCPGPPGNIDITLREPYVPPTED